jgi:hypothetical protein
MVLLAALAVPALAAVGFYYWSNDLPHPSNANRSELMRWLVLREVADQPKEVQVALVDRLQEELLDGLDAQSGSSGLDKSYRRQLDRNLDTLERVWFVERVRQYADVAPAGRNAFLEEQIAVIDAWSSLAGDASSGKERGGEGSSGASSFFDNIEDWIAAAKGEQRRQMIRGVRDGLVCWLATRDLAKQTMALRRDLAVRIARELDYGVEVGGGEAVQNERRRRLTANGMLLLEAWLHEQAALYARLEGDQRREFLDERIDRLIRWDLASLTDSSEKGKPSSAAASFLKLSQQVDEWIKRADASRREKLQKLADDLRRRVFYRSLIGTLPTSSSSGSDGSAGAGRSVDSLPLTGAGNSADGFD